MKKRALKVALLTVVLTAAVAMCASCNILTSFLGGVVQCNHTKVSKGNCLEYPTCLNCSETVGDTYGDHEYGEAAVTEPGCLTQGYTESVCRICNDTLLLGTSSALGHDFGGWEITKEPTSTSKGEMKRSCSRCDLTETDDIPAHEHTLRSNDAKAATCTEDGWEAYEYCTRCVYNSRTLIEAFGHSYGAYYSNGDGTHSRTCANDSSHVFTEPCSGGDYSGDSLPVCDYCNTAYEFAARPGNSTYGYYALGKYSSGEKMQALYKDLNARAESFFAGDENIVPNNGEYIIGEFDIKDYSLTSDEATAVWKIFYVSTPAYYWLDSAVAIQNDKLLLLISEDYSTAAYRRECDAAIEKMALECASLIDEDMSDLEKAMEITAFIVKGMEYAYESDGETPVAAMWAHNMTGLAMHGFGVCESYAKSFMYLCLLNGVECAMGTGYAGGEAHAWNYVNLDGTWYGADITWTDHSGDEVAYDTFGLSGASIYADHTPHSSTELGVYFIYEAPELATRDIELTALYKNGEKVGIYKSIGDAFGAMTDSEAEYEIDIAYYSYMEGAIAHTLDSDSTPEVKKLTVKGRSEHVGEGYYDMNTVLYMRSSLTLGSDVELQNLHVIIYDGVGSCTIGLGEHTLTLGGDSVYLQSRIEGTDHASSVVASASREVLFEGGVDIYKLVIKNGKVIFGADSHIVYATNKNFYYLTGTDVQIDYRI